MSPFDIFQYNDTKKLRENVITLLRVVLLVPEFFRNTKKALAQNVSSKQKVLDTFLWYATLWLTKTVVTKKWTEPEILRKTSDIQKFKKEPLTTVSVLWGKKNFWQYWWYHPMVNGSFRAGYIYSVKFDLFSVFFQIPSDYFPRGR